MVGVPNRYVNICLAVDSKLMDAGINFNRPMPVFDGPDYDREYREHYYTEAGLIVGILADVLPGGTWDALIVEMLKRHRSILVVRRRTDEERKKEDNESR